MSDQPVTSTSAVDLSTQTYLTIPQVREYLQFPSEDAVYRWVYRHRIPKCRVGRKLLFLRRDLDDAVRGRLRKLANKGVA